MTRYSQKKIILYVAMRIWMRNRRRQQRKYWVHPINQTRRSQGEFFTLMALLEHYPLFYFKYLRMSKPKFEAILKGIEFLLNPNPNNFRRDVISAKEKLVITLRFLAVGTSYTDLAFRFRMGIATILLTVNQTLIAIIEKFREIAIPSKRSEEDWRRITKEFLDRWNFPNCCAAIDGKHIHSFAPNNTGSLYFNYKKTFSTNLMAAVDAKYKFLMVNIGAYGSNADSTVFASCEFGKSWLHSPNILNIPDDAPLPGTVKPLPYVIIADEGFALKMTIMRPFPGQSLSTRNRIFNYRLSRARRVVENVFGILAQTWRILLNRLEVQTERINNITYACCILHNLLRMDDMSPRTPEQSGSHIEVSNQRAFSLQTASYAYDIREQFADWCINEGDVPFQYHMI